jgi:putative pyruvate formate lyase activating enzyme
MNTVKQADIFERNDRLILENCTLCPRECRVNRFEGELGYCGTDSGLNIATVCVHKGEEPVISGKKGICNIFFTGCNLHCLYCQNHEISHCSSKTGNDGINLEGILDRIMKILSEGVQAVGFVSPSHVVPVIKAIIKGLNSRGCKPVTV